LGRTTLGDAAFTSTPGLRAAQSRVVGQRLNIDKEKKHMSLTLKTRQVGEVTVVDVAGEILLGEGSSALREALRGLAAKPQSKILLNLGEVSYIDSTGIGELVGGFVSVTNHGGQLKLLNLIKRLRDLLQITKLATVFEVYDDEARAIQSFSQAAHA
jgi:anti-sigma B factor antagonist